MHVPGVLRWVSLVGSDITAAVIIDDALSVVCM